MTNGFAEKERERKARETISDLVANTILNGIDFVSGEYTSRPRYSVAVIKLYSIITLEAEYDY